MIFNNNESVNAIFVDNEFIKEIYIGDSSVYKQTLDGLKLNFLDNYKLPQLDSICVGKI